MAGDGETVIPSLPEPGVWTGMASANALGPLRWKRAKIHRGSRRRNIGPHQEAGYTSAVVTVEPDPVDLLQSGGVHIRPHMTQSRRREEWELALFLALPVRRHDPASRAGPLDSGKRKLQIVRRSRTAITKYILNGQ